MNKPQCQHFDANCPSRVLFEQIADKWSMMALSTIEAQPKRFNELKRYLEGITQRSLTQCLRKLERNGLVYRHVICDSPVAVEYKITPLGETLLPHFKALYHWTLEHSAEVESARTDYDEKNPPQ